MSSPTEEAEPGNGGTSKRPERKSDPNAAAALLTERLDWLRDSYNRAETRLLLNAERQDTMIAQATVALAEAKRILEQCGAMNVRIDTLPTRKDAEEMWARIAALSKRIDAAALADRPEDMGEAVVKVVRGLRWYQIILAFAGVAFGLVLLLIFLKRVGLV